MSQYSPGERIGKVIGAGITAALWWVFTPDYIGKVMNSPLAGLTGRDLTMAAVEIGATLFCLRLIVDMLYEATAGRDSVWLWHPD